MRRLAVWDWNGTLFDDMHATHIATNACLAFFNKGPITLEEEQETFTFPLIHFYEKMGVPVDHYLEHATEVGEIFHAAYNENKQQCGLARDVKKNLSWLQDQNVTHMILSNNYQQILDEDVARFNLEGYFHTISGNECPATIVSGTNKYERLHDYMQTYDFDPQHTMIIGDSHEEPDIARKLNIMGISVSGGLLSPARLNKYKKDYVIDCLSELPDILIDQWNLAPINKAG